MVLNFNQQLSKAIGLLKEAYNGEPRLENAPPEKSGPFTLKAKAGYISGLGATADVTFSPHPTRPGRYKYSVKFGDKSFDYQFTASSPQEFLGKASRAMDGAAMLANGLAKLSDIH